MIRREVLLTSLALALPAASVRAEDWPAKPITIVVSSAPGGSADLAARLIARYLPAKLNVPCIVQNKPGAAGQIGTRFVATSPPDGYTLLLANNAMNAGAEAIDTSGNSLASEEVFAGVGMVSWLPSTLVISRRLNVRTWKEFKALAIAKPEQLTYSTSNYGSAGHVSFLLLAQEYGIKLRAIPYNGGAPAIQAVASEDVDATIGPIQPMEGLVKAGRLVPVLELADQPSTDHADLPTASAAGVARAAVSSWLALVAPVHTPEATLGKLRAALDSVKADPQYTEDMKRLGIPARTGDYDVVAVIKAEKARTLKALKAQSITPKE